MNRPVILEAANLSKEFISGGETIRAFRGISLRLSVGEILAVTGPSGSGKSTLLTLLAGLHAPTSGSVKLDNQDLGVLSENELALMRRKKIGFVFQAYHLIPSLTALENTAVTLELQGRSDAMETAGDWLGRVGLSHRAQHRPAQLSGGEQQRVALARALAPAPALIFADEPTGNLDANNARAVAELLFSLVKQQGVSLVFVTHERSLAGRADKILELSDSRAAQG